MVRLVALLVALFLVAAAVPADAQGRGRGRPTVVPQSYERDVQQQEPAYARGYADGLRYAQDDRQDRRRYDPVAHSDYRDADNGFSRSYGSRDAYKNNYRAGFRAGYDAGYRDDSGRRR